MFRMWYGDNRAATFAVRWSMRFLLPKDKAEGTGTPIAREMIESPTVEAEGGIFFSFIGLHVESLRRHTHRESLLG